jgi:hypothetical protein
MTSVELLDVTLLTPMSALLTNAFSYFPFVEPRLWLPRVMLDLLAAQTKIVPTLTLP